MRFSILILGLMVLGIFGFSKQNKTESFQWKDGKKAAVCLTYDDGMECHLDEVGPALNKYGMRATFYCNGSAASLSNRVEDWRDLAAKGHELGNHSLYHPCNKNRPDGTVFDWVKPAYDLGNYSIGQIQEEIILANTLLHAIDGKKRRTYAYTCSDYEVSGTSYVEALDSIVTAARGEGPMPNNMQELNLYKMPSKNAAGMSGKEMIGYVEAARSKGTMAVFMFHGVGDGHLSITMEAHNELLEYLNQHNDEYWVAPFLEITDYIK